MSSVRPSLRQIVRPGDWAIFVVAVAIALASARFGASEEAVEADAETKRMVVVEVAGARAARWAMPDSGAVRRDTLVCPHGPVVIETNSRAVRVVASSCPDHWCEREGPLTGGTGALVCLPNHLVVRIEMKGSLAEVDAITQ